jgi:hypothetical protein
VTEVSKEASGGTQKSRGLWADFGVLAAVLPIGLAALRIVVYSGGDPTLMRVLIQTLNRPARASNAVLAGTSAAHR